MSSAAYFHEHVDTLGTREREISSFMKQLKMMSVGGKNSGVPVQCTYVTDNRRSSLHPAAEAHYLSWVIESTLLERDITIEYLKSILLALWAAENKCSKCKPLAY